MKFVFKVCTLRLSLGSVNDYCFEERVTVNTFFMLDVNYIADVYRVEEMYFPVNHLMLM